MLRRLIKALAFPIIATIFLIGWILYYVGSKSNSLTKKTETVINALEKRVESNTDEGIEIGLIEEKITTQYSD